MAPLAIQTGYPASPTSQAGVMLDLQSVQPIQLECLDTYFQTGGAAVTTVEIWWRNGTHVGHQTNPAQWTMIGRIDSLHVAATQSTPVHVPIDLNLSLVPGQTISLYVTNTDSTFSLPRVVYAIGTTTGLLQQTDGTLSIFEGSGIINYFGSVVASPRQFQGNLHYSLLSTGLPENNGSHAARVYPNPGTDVLVIEPGDHSFASFLTVRDILGREVPELTGPVNGTARLDISGLEPGPYLIQLAQGQEQQVLRFVKN